LWGEIARTFKCPIPVGHYVAARYFGESVT
jgi:hypothetical protein